MRKKGKIILLIGNFLNNCLILMKIKLKNIKTEYVVKDVVFDKKQILLIYYYYSYY